MRSQETVRIEEGIGILVLISQPYINFIKVILV